MTGSTNSGSLPKGYSILKRDRKRVNLPDHRDLKGFDQVRPDLKCQFYSGAG